MDDAEGRLADAGLPADLVRGWTAATPAVTGDFRADATSHTRFWQASSDLLRRLPAKARRSPAEAEAANVLLASDRKFRAAFLARHAAALYDRATGDRTRFVRVEDLVHAAGAPVPGLLPTREDVAAEAALAQGEKDGAEIDQGLFLAVVLADAACGLHLCHAMLLPRSESRDAAARFARDGELDLGPVRLERRGKAALLTASNPAVLNAEDDTTLDAMEVAVDVATLDRTSEVAVLRGGKVAHAKYAGRRVFGAGINLTALYFGRIPFLWFIKRDMGFVHKLFRGVALPDVLPDDVHGAGIEKLWIAAVDAFAIGGHCQVLLCMDYVLAASDAFLTLPARKEGIIPGLANLRLPRFTGDRIARQAVNYERRLECASPEGRLICDAVAPPDGMDAALDEVISGLTNSGAVSAVGNRRAFRVGLEPLDLFRRYMAVYAREQAWCHFSPALIANLERNWQGARRP